MYLAKNRIRVIKREEREQQLQREQKTTDQNTVAESNVREVKQQETVSTVKGWVSGFLRRRQQQHRFQ